MLIYADSGVAAAPAPIQSTTSYKSVHKNRQRSSTRTKALKRGGKRRQKVKKVKKVRKVKRGIRKPKKLNVKNIKFLKTLGFKVKKSR